QGGMPGNGKIARHEGPVRSPCRETARPSPKSGDHRSGLINSDIQLLTPIKAITRPGDVLAVDFHADPPPPQLFGDGPGHVASGERVEHQLPGFAEEADEEVGHRLGKSRRVDRKSGGAAALDVRVAGAGVGHLQEVRWDGAAVVTAEVRAELVLA